MTHPIIIMLATPRSVSTAFERSFMERGDFLVMHEPFTKAWFLNHHPSLCALFLSLFDEINQATTPEAVMQFILDKAQHQPVFVKAIAGAAEMLLNHTAFLAHPNIKFAVLIRDPRTALQSVYWKYKETNTPPDAVKAHYKHEVQYRLIQRLKTLGKPTIILEGETLAAHPDKVMQRFCQATDINYKPEALHWTPEFKETWRACPAFFDELSQSDGLKTKTLIPIKAFSEDIPENDLALLEQLLKAQQPYYEAIKTLIPKHAFLMVVPPNLSSEHTSSLPNTYDIQEMLPEAVADNPVCS